MLVSFGHGRAIRTVLANGDKGREELILDACRRDTVFDRYFEQSHGYYLSELLIATGRPDFYLDRLIVSAASIRRSADLTQWAELLAEMALRGSDVADRYIRGSWDRYLAQGECDMAASYIRTAEPEAYAEVLDRARVVWRFRRTPPSGASSLHWVADDRLGEEEARKVRAPFEDDPEFAPLADFPTPPAPSIPETQSVEERILAGRFASTNGASDQDIRRAAALLATDLEPEALKSALRFFTRVPFPGDVSLLLRWVDDADEDIQYRARRAAIRNRDPRVRDLAHRYAEGRSRHFAIGALAENFEPGDELWIEQMLRQGNPAEEIHAETLRTLDVVKANGAVNWRPVLRFLYEENRCTLCRGTLAERLYERDALTEEDLNDLLYDADSGNREWARKILNPSVEEEERVG